MKTKIQIRIEVRSNHNPDNGPIGDIGFSAYFARQWETLEIKGCPLGTGHSPEAAIADLLFRTNNESSTTIARDDLAVEGPEYSKADQ